MVVGQAMSYHLIINRGRVLCYDTCIEGGYMDAFVSFSFKLACSQTLFWTIKPPFLFSPLNPFLLAPNIDIKHHFIRSHIVDGTFSTTWLSTSDMPADIFTKQLPLPIFVKHRTSLGLFSVPS